METNIKEYAAIALSFSTYEERVRLHRAELDLKRQQTIEKLKALGATDDDILTLSQ
jgi:hypothetical protein